MNLTNILLVAALIYGTFLVVGMLFEKEAPWEKKLERLRDFLNGQMEPIDNYPNSYRIKFVYEGQRFEFEAIEDPGFKTHAYKGSLKIKSHSQLSLSFMERERTTIYSEVGTSAEIINPLQTQSDVRVPSTLKEFKIFTSNVRQANYLLADSDIVNVFTSLKNLDPRGHPVMSLDIKEGMIVLVFHPTGQLKPSLAELLSNVKLIQGYTEKLIVLVRMLNYLEARDKAR